MTSNSLISICNRLNKNVGEVNDDLRLLSGAPPSAFLFGGVFCVQKENLCCAAHSLRRQIIYTP